MKFENYIERYPTKAFEDIFIDNIKHGNITYNLYVWNLGPKYEFFFLGEHKPNLSFKEVMSLLSPQAKAKLALLELR